MGVLIALHVAGVAWSAAARAQPVTLSGRVTDARTGEALPLANVVLEGAATGTATDEAGFFALRGLAPGTYTLAVSYLGYRPYREQITLAAAEERRVQVALVPQELSIEEVVVTAQDAEAQDLGAATLPVADVAELPTVLEPDLFRALQLLPGIQAVSDFSSGLYIRGGSPDQTLILLDGAPIYNPTHVFGFFSTFNPDAIGEVLVYKGGYPARYGGRLGSVVALESRRGTAETEGRLSLGLLASRASAGGPHPWGTWMLAVRRSTLEPLLAALNAAEVGGIPERFSFYDVNGRVDLDLAPCDRLSLRFYAGQDRLLYPFLDEARFDVAYGNRAGSASWRHAFSDRITTRLTATASRYASDPRAEFGGTDFRQANTLTDYTLRGRMRWQAAPRHTLEAGFKTGRFGSEVQRTFDDVERFTSRLETQYAAAYVQDTYRPHERWTLTGGLRGSYYTNGAFARLAPRLSVAYRPTGALRLQAGYGRYVQYLALASSPFFSAFDTWLITSEGVSPSYGDQFLAGLQAELPGAWCLDVEGYYRTMRGLFNLDPQIPDVTGRDYAEVFRFGEGYAYGLEVFLRRSAGAVGGFLSYAYSKTMRRYRGFEGFRYYPPKYDRRHSLNLVMNYDFAPAWRLTSVFTYGSGQPYTAPQRYFKLQDSPLGSTTITTFVAPFNAARLPPYHRLDLGVRKAGRLFGIAEYELLLQVVNVYGRRNVWFYFFEPEEDNTITRSEVPQIPIPLPNVSLTLEF